MTLGDLIEIITIYDIRKVDFVANLVGDTGYKDKDGKATYGYCDHKNRCIYVDKNQSLNDLRSILIHELVHAWIHVQGKEDVDRNNNDLPVVEKLENAIFNQLYKPKEYTKKRR